jgi:hypothetical protein
MTLIKSDKIKRLFNLVLIVSLCFCFWSFADDKSSCSKYKTGTFLFNSKSYGKTISCTCIRKENVQTDIDNITGEITKAGIRWLGDCTFEMRLISTTRKLSKSELAAEKKVVLTVNITGGTDRFYLFNATHNLYKGIISDTVWIKK